jgi:hypothetical protein
MSGIAVSKAGREPATPKPVEVERHHQPLKHVPLPATSATHRSGLYVLGILLRLQQEVARI